jgi:cytochrome P450
MPNTRTRFTSRQHNYIKAITSQPLRAFLGLGLPTSEAEVWERHRRIVGPVFVRRHHRVRTRNRRRVEIGFVQPSLRRAPDAEAGL